MYGPTKQENSLENPFTTLDYSEQTRTQSFYNSYQIDFLIDLGTKVRLLVSATNADQALMRAEYLLQCEGISIIHSFEVSKKS